MFTLFYKNCGEIFFCVLSFFLFNGNNKKKKLANKSVAKNIDCNNPKHGSLKIVNTVSESTLPERNALEKVVFKLGVMYEC